MGRKNIYQFLFFQRTDKEEKGRLACPWAAAKIDFLPWRRRERVKRMEDQPEACLKRASVHFSYLGALGTMRPTFSFPFEGLGAGRAACPQAAA